MTLLGWIGAVMAGLFFSGCACAIVLGWKNRRPKYRYVTYTRRDVKLNTHTWRGP